MEIEQGNVEKDLKHARIRTNKLISDYKEMGPSKDDRVYQLEEVMDCLIIASEKLEKMPHVHCPKCGTTAPLGQDYEPFACSFCGEMF